MKDPEVILALPALLDRWEISWPLRVRKEKRVTKDFKAHPALLDPHHSSRKDHKQFFVGNRGSKEKQGRKATRAPASHICTASKAISAQMDHRVNLARMETMGHREKKAFLEPQDTLVYRVKKEKGDHLVGVLALPALLVPQVQKERKVFLVLGESQVYQANTLKGLVERRVRKERWAKRETEVWKESLLSDLQDNRGTLVLLDHPDHQSTLVNVTFRRGIVAHLDLQGYKGKWDRKVTKGIPVFSVKARAHLDYLVPQVLKETQDLLVQ